MAPPGMPQPGASPGQPGTPSEPRSAVEQAAGGTDQLVPGEAEDFMAMRQDVEDGPDQQMAEMMAQ